MDSLQFPKIIGKSTAIRTLLDQVKIIAESSSSTVLIYGESGTGKQLIARGIHAAGPKSQGPFIELNCASIPELLLEAELFGYEMGAFTDARNRKKGLLELANDGAIFLDEINSLSVNLQAKLLKVIDDKIFRRLGGVDKIAVDVRIITATNSDLKEAIAAQAFREDLYYRLHVMAIELPPLRDREDDRFLLAQHFIDRYNEEYSKQVKGLSESAISLVGSYSWPGNVRELKNMIERAVLLESKDYLEAEDLSINRCTGDRDEIEQLLPQVPGKTAPQITPTVLAHDTTANDIVVQIPEQGVSFEDVERRFLEESLKMSRWNVRRAARLLDMSYDTFRYRMQKHGLK
jgi:two-component system response regulator AtoC